MNNKQAKIIAQYKDLAEKSAKDVTVEVTEHEGYDFVSVMIKAEEEKVREKRSIERSNAVP